MCPLVMVFMYVQGLLHVSLHAPESLCLCDLMSPPICAMFACDSACFNVMCVCSVVFIHTACCVALWPLI